MLNNENDANIEEKTEGDKNNFKNMPKNKKSLGIGLAAIAVLLIVVVVTVANQPKKIDIEEFVEVGYTGYENYGTPQVYLDTDGLYNEIMAAVYSKDINLNTSQDFYMIESSINSISLDVQPNENLSNGDKITVDISYDNDLLKEFNIKFKGKSVSTKVEGLEVATEIDPFKDLTVNFSGISPYGKVEYSYDGDNSYIDEYSFSIDNEGGIKNGDVVTVSVDASDESALNSGYVLTVKEKTYEVEGLEEYVENYGDLSSDFIDKVHGESEDVIYAYVASTYEDEVSLTDLAYSGYIFNILNPDSSYSDPYNDLYVIYSGTVSHSEKSFNAVKVYYPVRYSNISKIGDDISYSDTFGISGNSDLQSFWYNTQGYTNPLTCYMELVEANRENYVSESGDGFEIYTEQKPISQLSDISQDYRDQLGIDAKDTVESYIASDYNQGSRLSDLALKGEYLLVSKNQGTDYENNNKYIMVYSGTASNDNGDFDSTTVYFPVEYDGIVGLPNEEYMVTASQGIVGLSDIGDSWYTTKGYVDGSEMFSEIVTANRDVYTYEVSEGLKEFGD